MRTFGEKGRSDDRSLVWQSPACPLPLGRSQKPAKEKSKASGETTGWGSPSANRDENGQQAQVRHG